MNGHNPELWKRDKPELQSDFLVRERISGWLGEVKDLRILEAGCGEGYIARKLKSLGALVDGFDKDPRMIDLALKLESRVENPIPYKVGELSQVQDLYSSNTFDVAIISGVICFLDEHQLQDCLNQMYTVIKPDGRLLIATNHTDSFFEKAKSPWLDYLTEPDLRLDTQLMSLNFNHPSGGLLFTGECYFHTPLRVRSSMEQAGFKILSEYKPLATEEDMKHHPHMWGDECLTFYHLVIIGAKQ